MATDTDSYCLCTSMRVPTRVGRKLSLGMQVASVFRTTIATSKTVPNLITSTMPASLGLHHELQPIRLVGLTSMYYAAQEGGNVRRAKLGKHM